MLKLLSGSGEILRCDTYYIREKIDGLDEVIFTIDVWDPVYPELVEETPIRDRDKQTYLIKQIDQGEKTAKIIGHLDLDAWKAQLLVGYNNGTTTVGNTVAGILPSGWTLTDLSGSTIRRQVNGAMTPYEICKQCEKTFGVWFRWDNAAKTCTIRSKTPGSPSGAFATRDLNLKQINYKGKSDQLVTRLYAYGKDDMTFASINGGKAYVDNFTYTTKILPGYWKDERYTVKESLLEDARSRLADLAVPKRSYECKVIDLQAVDPAKYGFLDFGLYTVATLIDDIKNLSVNYQVAERRVYPYYPENNEVIFDSSPERLTGIVDEAVDVLETKVSSAAMQTEIDRATGVLQTGYSGYVMLNRNSEGFANELLVMDTNSLETAQHVLRINRAGIGFSSNGYAGPYYQAWTIDGHLSLGGVNNSYGTLEILNSSGQIIGKWNKDGITVNSGLIQGPQIVCGGANNANGQILIRNGSGQIIGRWDKDGIFVQSGSFVLGSNRWDSSGLYMKSGSIQIGNKFSVDSNGNLTAKDGTFTGNINSGSTITGAKILSSEIGTTNDEFYVVENGDGEVEIGFSGFDCWDKILRTNWIGSVENPATNGDDAGINGRTGDAGFKRLYLLDGWYEGSDGSMWDVTRTIRWLDNRLRSIEDFCASHDWDGESGGDDGDDPGSGGDDGYLDDGDVENDL